MADKEAASSKLDISLLRTPIQISGKPVEQVLNSIHYGSPELRCLLMDECDLIFECKVCRALFRDLPNFISHKRVYCTKSSMENRHVTIASLPEEKVVVIQPHAPEETEQGVPTNTQLAGQQTKTPRPNLEETILRIQSGELGRSHAYQVYTEAAEKLQRQKEGMKVATIRTTPIPTNKNAVFIDVNMTSVNIHERQQHVSSGIVSSFDQNRNDNSVTVIKRKTGERLGNTRNIRKSIKQERPSSEPQKLLMEQLKEIQHKVKQKVAAAQDKAVQQKRVRIAPQNSSSEKDIASALTSESSQKVAANTTTSRVQKKTSDTSGLKVLTSDNVQSVLTKEEETTVNVKDDSDTEGVKYALVRRKTDGKMCLKAAKENKSDTVSAVVAVKNRRKFAKRSPICSKCNSVFATRKSLGFHIKIHHSAKRTFYPCPYCSSVFYYFFGITRHLSRNHSKTLEEIDEMRKQLREKSYTKPLFISSLKDETSNVSGSSRSARTLGRYLISSVSEDTWSTVTTSQSSDKQLPKRTSGDSETTTSESTSKIVRQKNAQLNTTQGEFLHSLRSSVPTAGEKIDVLDGSKLFNTKEDMGGSRPVRLKNRQQQRTADNAGKPSKSDNLVDASLGMNTSTPSQTSSSAVSRSQESTSHVCPKCHRAFRRKISCKNHMKVCKTRGSRALKTVMSQNTGYKSRQLTSDSTTSRDIKPTKVKNRDKKSSNDSSVKPVATGNDEVKTVATGNDEVKTVATGNDEVKTAEKKEVDVVGRIQDQQSDSLRQQNSRDAQMSSTNKTASWSRRSSSVDRVIPHDESRNRSRERNSSGRDKRDSSVESTQSNVEGKSPRSRRNVLSRYATPVQLSISPSKFDASLKTDMGNDSDGRIMEGQDISQLDVNENSSETGDNLLLSDREKVFKEGNEDNVSKSKNEPATVSEKTMLNLPPAQVKTRASSNRNVDMKNSEDKHSANLPSTGNDVKLVLTGEMNKTTTSPQKSLPLPLSPTSSPQKLEGSSAEFQFSLRRPFPHIISVAPHKNLSFHKEVGSLSKPEASSPHVKSSEDKSSSAPPAKFVENITTIAESVKAEKEKSDQKSEKDPLKIQQVVELDSLDFEHHILTEDFKAFRDSLLEGVPQKQERVEEKSAGLLQAEDDSKPGSPDVDLTKQNTECLDVKKPEMSSEEQTILELSKSSANLKNKDRKPQILSQNAVVSALSERPKRKRKVPSKNMDAEEMLSKIHSHNRETVPSKKAKITREAKGADNPKQKFKSENIKRDTFSLANCDGKDDNNIVNKAACDKKGTRVNEDKLSQEDDSFEAVEESENDNEELGKAKGRFVSNRMYVLEKFGSKRKRLKCYDQVKVYKLIDEEKRKCLQCGESCTQVSNLRRHVIRQHLRWSRYKCKLCKFESYDRSECTTHLIRGHKNRTINLRNVNHYIIDLVKQGSRARSLKKTETIKVKQQSESQEGNIYARPTVKKMLRLPQRAEGETKNRTDKDLISINKDGQKTDLQPQTKIKEESVPAQKSSEVKPKSTYVPVSQPAPVVVTVPTKLVSALTSLPKVGTFSTQSAQCQTSLKSGPDLCLEVKDVSLKAARKNLPFNISTRNSPRTFDTRPYNPEKNSIPAKTENIVQREDSLTLTGNETLVKVVSPTGNMIKKCDHMVSDSVMQVETVMEKMSHVVANADNELENISTEFSSTDGVQKSRNIFDKMRTQPSSSISSDTISLSNESSDILPKAVPSSSKELNVGANNVEHHVSSARVIEVKVESPLQAFDLPDQHKHLSQSPDVSKKPATVHVDSSKAKVISYIIRGPQKKVSQGADETMSTDQLAKSLIKLKELGDQFSSSVSVPSSQQILKTALTATRVSSQVIDTASLQQKQTIIPVSSASIVKSAPVEHLKIAPQRSAAVSKETPGSSSSGMALAATLAKGGHISTTNASSFILSHSQAGKFIIYTRPAGAKELTTVGSLAKPSAASSPLPSSSAASTTNVKSSDASSSPSSQTEEATVKDVFPQGTFVIRKHYL